MGWRSKGFIALIPAVMACCLSLTAASVSALPGDQIITPRLVADVESLSGGKFRIGVLFSIAPGWHIYWKNPGDAGLPTKVMIELPEGYTAKSLDWPIPVKFEQRAGVIGYGYTSEVLLSEEVFPASSSPPSAGQTFKAKVSWVGCSNVCVPGRKDLELELPPGANTHANTQLFRTWAERIAHSWNENGKPFSWSLSESPRTRGDYELRLEWPKDISSLEVFPYVGNPYDLQDFSVSHTGTVSKIRFRLARDSEEPARLPPAFEAVIVPFDGAGLRYSEAASLRVPLPAAGNAESNAVAH